MKFDVLTLFPEMFEPVKQSILGRAEENKLIGIMGTKNEGKHISLFFIKKEFHRKGIGKQLFDYSQCDCPANEITVNSSTYAIKQMLKLYICHHKDKF
jgi:GNAT superfamily N-acetyltransferase